MKKLKRFPIKKLKKKRINRISENEDNNSYTEGWEYFSPNGNAFASDWNTGWAMAGY